jgi:hypothetical protein
MLIKSKNQNKNIALALPWHCLGIALALPWHCLGIAKHLV